MTLTATPSNPVPSGAVTGMLTAADGTQVRFARFPPTQRRRGTVCVFPGRTEFIEKYFEVVEDLRERGFAVAILDWRGQGGSARKLKDPRKGHVRRFEEFQLDLEIFVKEVVLPDCPPPHFALAHSMGGAILLQAAKAGRRWFDRMVLSAPMIDLTGLARPRMARGAIRAARRIGLGGLYVPGGGATAVTSIPFAGNPVTTDAARYRRTAEIVEANPALGLGSPTIGWADEAFRAMEAFADPAYPSSLRQPVLAVAAGDDPIVSTPAIERFGIRLLAGTVLVVPGSRHELLQERDAIRSQFWAAFDAFVPGTSSF